MARGTALQLTCSLSCDEDIARVQWRGLDTDLGNVQTLPGSSILSIHGMLTDTGTRTCVGSCGTRTLQHRTMILVYGEDHSDLSGATPMPSAPGSRTRVLQADVSTLPIPDT